MPSIEEIQKEQIEKSLVNVLAHIYRAVNWRKIHARSAYDVFEHRLEYSRHEIDIPSFIQKLCNKLSLQAPSLPLDDVQLLRANEKEAMILLRTMGKLLTLEAAEHAKVLKQGVKENK